MPDRLMIIASDAQWIQAPQVLVEKWVDEHELDGFDRLTIETYSTESKAIENLYTDPRSLVSALVIYGFHAQPTMSNERAGQGYGAVEACRALRQVAPRLPLMLVAPVRLDVLERYAAKHENVEIICEVSSHAICAALDKMKVGDDAKQPWAMVDIYVGTESIRVQVMLANGKVLSNKLVPSDMLPFLNDTQKEFLPAKWALYKADGATRDDYQTRFCTIGERLHQYLLSEPQKTAIATCLERVGSMDNILFRVVTNSHEFPDVPFEVMRDDQRREFVRIVSPLARTLLLTSAQSNVALTQSSVAGAMRTLDQQRDWRVLVIISKNDDGRLRVGQHRFDNGSEAKSFGQLPKLNEEFGRIRGAYASAAKTGTKVRLRPCVLRTKASNRAKIRKLLMNEQWDAVHFCGHSVRADDDEVFLVLPGLEDGQLEPLKMSEFARYLRGARVKLLVLSSCEGASSRGLFRVAQEGIPAIVGFRWQVMSDESMDFSECLHRNLAEGLSLGRAYLEAVRSLTDQKPAFYSAMLVAQNDAWAKPIAN